MAKRAVADDCAIMQKTTPVRGPLLGPSIPARQIADPGASSQRAWPAAVPILDGSSRGCKSGRNSKR